jgi:hypothetical protein
MIKQQCPPAGPDLPGFTPRGTLADAAFDLRITIAGPVSSTAFRFRRG